MASTPQPDVALVPCPDVVDGGLLKSPPTLAPIFGTNLFSGCHNRGNHRCISNTSRRSHTGRCRQRRQDDVGQHRAMLLFSAAQVPPIISLPPPLQQLRILEAEAVCETFRWQASLRVSTRFPVLAKDSFPHPLGSSRLGYPAPASCKQKSLCGK